MRVLIWSFVFIFLTGCSSDSNTNNKQSFTSGQLVHTVILKFNEGTSAERKKESKTVLESLGDIKETHGLFIAEPADTPDPRAVKDYDFILQAAFNSAEELAKYSTNAYHIEVRNQIKDELSAAPLVFDYWID